MNDTHVTAVQQYLEIAMILLNIVCVVLSHYWQRDNIRSQSRLISLQPSPEGIELGVNSGVLVRSRGTGSQEVDGLGS